MNILSIDVGSVLDEFLGSFNVSVENGFGEIRIEEGFVKFRHVGFWGRGGPRARARSGEVFFQLAKDQA